jgi:hypothetical protein
VNRKPCAMNHIPPWNSVIKTPIRPAPGAKINPASPTTVADFHALGYAPLVVGAEIDIPTGHGLVAIYANTMDTKLAGLIWSIVFKFFETTPTRFGNGPPALYLIATSAPIERDRVEFGEKDHVDILSEGCQFVASGKPYVWVRPLVPFDQLTVFPPSKILEFLKELRSVLPVAKPRIAEGAASNVSQAPVSTLPAAKPLITEGVSNVSQAPVSPLAEEIGPLVNQGYLKYLRPSAPPAVEWHTRGGVKISDGKLPGKYAAGEWSGFPGWPTHEPKLSNIPEWSAWPGAGICLVTGEICAFDIDVKFDRTDQSESAKRGRALIQDIGKVLAARIGWPLPVRGRANSTSCAVFVRLNSRVGKQGVTLVEAGPDRKHKIEFLAAGQQIVVAGMHDSGVRVRSSLAKFALDRIPMISAETLQEIMGEISAVAQRHGYTTEKKAPLQAKRALGAMRPDQVVAREIFRRRADWVPSIIPCTAGKADQDWRISSAELERDLVEEDLCIYSSGRGIHDFGTERDHSVVSFIREFGVIDDAGEILFGGCPRYGRRGKAEFAVVGEHDPAPHRPTESEALNWLCKKFAGEDPALPADATWSKSWRAVAAAVGLDWQALEALQVNLLFDYIDEAGVAHPFKPDEWSADDLKRNRWLLPAIRATDPDWFAKLEFAWELTGAASSTEVSTAIATDAARVREHAVAVGYAGIFAEAAAPNKQAIPAGDLIKSSAEFVKGFVPPEYLIDGVLQRRFCYAITAQTGVGKTAVTMLLASLVATGRALDGREVAKGSVLYFAGENPTDIQMRWLGLTREMKMDPETADVHFVPGVVPLSKVAGRIAAEVSAKGLQPALVVVDTSAAYFEGDDENSNTQAVEHARRMRALTELPGGPCVLILCHPTKRANDDDMIPRGGGAFLAEVDGNIALHKRDNAIVASIQGKFRGPEFPPLSFALKTMEHPALRDAKGRPIPTVVARPISAGEQQRRAVESLSQENQVLKAIHGDPNASSGTIAETLGWRFKNGDPARSKVTRCADTLVKAKLLRKHGRRFQITSAGETEIKQLAAVLDADNVCTAAGTEGVEEQAR